MDADSEQKRNLAAARRGLIVQRVLVDGRTPEEAGKPFGVEGRSVARWVAAYRRHGMAALREDEKPDGAWRRWIEGCLARIGAWLQGVAAIRSIARRGDGGGTPQGPTRHRRWK